LCRSTEWELIAVALSEGLGVIPWSPLRGGWLSGKFRRGMTEPPKGSRIDVASQKGWDEAWEHYNNESTWRVLDALQAVATEVGKTPAQVAINWLLRKPAVTAPIVGARRMEQLENNLAAVGWELDSDHLKQLDEASRPSLPYPYNFIEAAAR
jgi:aryl-alcohol dehydrogenase-like predicted oxidoreductase